MNHKTNAPRWLALRDQVLATIGTRYSPRDDKTTFEFMKDATARLMEGKPLTPAMAKTFITNVQCRTKHKKFVWDGDIALTENQRKYARSSGQHVCALPQFRRVETRDEMREQLEAFQLAFTHISSHFQPAFNSLSSILTPKQLETLGFSPSNTNTNEKVNTNGDFTADAADFGAFAPPPISTDEEDTHKAKSTPTRDFNPVSSISWWHKDGKIPSANIKLDGKTYHCVFQQYENAEAHFADAHSFDWRTGFHHSIGDPFRQQARALGGNAERHCMSALYNEGNSWGNPDQVVPDAACLLDWENDVPVRAMLIVGEDALVANLTRNNSTKAGSPAYRGQFKRAA